MLVKITIETPQIASGEHPQGRRYLVGEEVTGPVAAIALRNSWGEEVTEQSSMPPAPTAPENKALTGAPETGAATGLDAATAAASAAASVAVAEPVSLAAMAKKGRK